MTLGTPRVSQHPIGSAILEFLVSRRNTLVRHLNGSSECTRAVRGVCFQWRKNLQKFTHTILPSVAQGIPRDRSSSRTPHTKSSDFDCASYMEASLEILSGQQSSNCEGPLVLSWPCDHLHGFVSAQRSPRSPSFAIAFPVEWQLNESCPSVGQASFWSPPNSIMSTFIGYDPHLMKLERGEHLAGIPAVGSGSEAYLIKSSPGDVSGVLAAGDTMPDVDSTGPLLAAPDCTVVIATLNEVGSIPALLQSIAGIFGQSISILVVDDGSTDGTRGYLEAAAKAYPNLSVVLNDQPLTLAKAQAQGLGLSTTEYVVFMDGDLHHPPEFLPRILDKLREGFDIVIASRYIHGGSTKMRPPLRGIISRVACLIARLTLANAREIRDPLSGFFGVRRNIVLDTRGAPSGFELLLFVLAGCGKRRMVEIPYVFEGRTNGESKIVRGVNFARIFLSQLLADKKIELNRNRSHGDPLEARSESGGYKVFP